MVEQMVQMASTRYQRIYDAICERAKNRVIGGYANQRALGYRHTDETRRKMSLAQVGKSRLLTEETKRKIGMSSIGNQRALGYRHTDEAKRKIAHSLIGNKHSPGWPKGKPRGRRDDRPNS
jgi:hypothetical protein